MNFIELLESRLIHASVLNDLTESEMVEEGISAAGLNRLKTSSTDLLNKAKETGSTLVQNTSSKISEVSRKAGNSALDAADRASSLLKKMPVGDKIPSFSSRSRQISGTSPLGLGVLGASGLAALGGLSDAFGDDDAVEQTHSTFQDVIANATPGQIAAAGAGAGALAGAAGYGIKKAFGK